MFINVQPLNGPPHPLTYSIEQCDSLQSLVGAIVQVPLQNRTIYAQVIDYGQHLGAHASFTIRPIVRVEPLPHDPRFQQFIQALAHYYQLSPTQILRRLHQFFAMPHQSFITDQQSEFLSHTNMLSTEQQAVYENIHRCVEQHTYQSILLHGVTGSGKTEIYKKLIADILDMQQTAIVMLPEVALALQFEHILKQSFADRVISFHSASNKIDKTKLWHELLAQKPLVIIGVHQPILLPIGNLGLIIVDEEHETGYQEKKHPKINSKEAALIRARQYQISILLGSATPSVTSLYNTQKRDWHLFKLPHRYRGAFPQINVVYLTEQQQRRHFWISQELDNAISATLAKKEQVILFLNRRGFSFFVQCATCGHTFTCSRCSVSLTLHNDDFLHCHYCGARKKLLPCCPRCHKKDFLKKGIGTQQLVAILQKLFPTARLARADLDTTRQKKAWHQTMAQFNAGEIDILVGTQTITKGYHFAHVTLVGIIWADLHINLPHFNATQHTLQLLLQVAGRAGREHPNSTVVVQAMTHHPIFEHLHEYDYQHFLGHELQQRTLLGYPPCGRFAEIEFTHFQEAIVVHDAAAASSYLVSLSLPQLTVLGPATPSVAKIKNINRRTLYLKAPTIASIITAYQMLKKQNLRSAIHFNPSA